MSELTPAFQIKYQSEFTTKFQTEASLLRDKVWVKNTPESAGTKFPILGEASSNKNRPVFTPVTGTSQKHSSVTVNFDRYDAVEPIDHLQEFMTNIDVRSGYTQIVSSALGRDMDTCALQAFNSSNTSAGAAAPFDLALISKLDAMTYKYKWRRGMKKTLIISSAVKLKLNQLEEYNSSIYNPNMPLKNGDVPPFMGWDIVVHPDLDTADYWNSSTNHNCFAVWQGAVGLGINQDIQTRIGYNEDKLSWQVSALASFGAGVILPEGVFKVAVNNLTAL